MWAQILLMVLAVLKDFPELMQVFQQMQTTGTDTPTDAQYQQLADAVNARYAADLRWDSLKAAHRASMNLPVRGNPA